MVHSDEFLLLSKDETDELVRRRMELRNMFCSSPERREECLRMLEGAKVFSKVEPTDVADCGARNLMVHVMDEMGLFDHEFLLHMLENLMAFPLVPADTKR